MLKLTDLVLEELHSEVELFEGVDLCAEDSSRIKNLELLLRAYSEGHKETTALREENARLLEAIAQVKTNVEFMVHGQAGEEFMEYLESVLQEGGK